MTCYLGNAFSAGMLDTLVEDSVNVTFTLLTVEQASAWVREHAPRSCVGHADTAALVSALLGTSVALNRVSTSLRPGDKLLVAQYNGPRLPEGATSLPEGATLRWILATLAG